MSFVEELREEAKGQSLRRLWIDAKRRSQSSKGSLQYTLFRSRGFLVRRLSRTAREIVEASGIALVASPLIAVSSLKLWVLQLILMSLVEGIYQALKGSVLDFRRLNRRSAALGASSLIAIFQTVIALTLYNSSINFPALQFLFAARAIGFLIEVYLGSYYFDVTARKRVFIPLKWPLFFVGLSLLSVVSMTQLSAQWALYLIVLSHAAIRIWDQWIGFRCTREAEKQLLAFEKPLVRELHVDTNDQSNSDFNRNDLTRIFVWSSLFISPLILSLALRDMGHTVGSTLLWTILGLMIRITERPFRAFSVDLMDAILKHQWTTLDRALRSAIRSSLILSVAGLILLVGLVGIFYRTYLPLVSLLLLVSTFQRVLINTAGAIGLDKQLFLSSLVPRALGAILYLIAPTEGLHSLLIYFIGFEAVSACINGIIVLRVNLAKKVEEDFVERAIALTPEPKYLPIHFLTAWKMLYPTLQRHQIPQIHMILSLSESKRNSNRMKEFLGRFKERIRPGDLIMAVTSRTLAAWMPGADPSSFEIIRRRLMLEFPIEIEEIHLLSKEEFVNHLLVETHQAKSNLEKLNLTPSQCSGLMSLEFDSNERNRILNILSKMTSPLSLSGRWWMKDQSGSWFNDNGERTNSSQNEVYSLMEHEATGQVILHKPIYKSIFETNEVVHALRPFGAPIALFVCGVEVPTEEILRHIAKIQTSILATLLEGSPPSSLFLSMTRFKVVSILSQSICKRHNLDFTHFDERTAPSKNWPEETNRLYHSKNSQGKPVAWGIKVLLLSLLSGFASMNDVRASSILPQSLQGTLLCSGERPDDPLVFESNGLSHSVVEFDFRLSPFVPAYLACARWLEEVKFSTWYGLHPVEAVELLSPLGTEPVVRLKGELQKKLYASCLNRGHCRLRLPFRWLAFLDWIQSLRVPPSSFLKNPTCQYQEKVQPPKPISLVELEKRELKNLQDIKVSFSPLYTLADAILDAIEEKNASSRIIASAMNFSEKDLLNIIESLQKNPRKSLLLLYDFNPVSLDDELLKLTEAQWPPNLKMMPIFSTSMGKRYFHFKGVGALDGNGRFYFSSANLKNNLGFQTFDLGFSATEPNANNSLVQNYLDVMKDHCQRLAQLTCSLDARYAPGHILRKVVYDQAQDACHFIRTDPKYQKFLQKRYVDIFHPVASWDAVSAYSQHVASAQKSLGISTHALTLESLFLPLDSKIRAGVSTQIVVGFESAKSQSLNVPKGLSIIDSRGTLGTQAHTKSILVDDSRLIWGTGNLSYNGLVDSHEFFFFTRDKTLVHSVRRYIASFMNPSPVTSSFLPNNQECVVWIPRTKEFKDQASSEILQSLEATRAPGLFTLKEGRLKKCIMSRLDKMLCTQKDLFACTQ